MKFHWVVQKTKDSWFLQFYFLAKYMSFLKNLLLESNWADEIIANCLHFLPSVRDLARNMQYAINILACNEIPNILIPVTCSFLLKWLHLSNPTIGGIANFIPEISLQRFSAFFSQNKSSYLYKGNDHVIHFILIIWLFCNYRRAKARQDVLLIVCSFPSSFESIKQACPLSVMVCYHTRRPARKAFILYM